MDSQKWYSYGIGILGISIIIIIHELGHFLACKIAHVGTPIFSLGFGPRLAAITIKTTTFQIAALPFGGYVSIDPVTFGAQPFLVKFLIMIAGIIGNFLFAFCIFTYLTYSKNVHPEFSVLPEEDFTVEPKNKYGRLKLLQRMAGYLFAQESSGRSIIGPIGIISLTGKSLAYGKDLFLFILAVISINIGMFNLLPIPGLDGFQLLMLFFGKIF